MNNEMPEEIELGLFYAPAPMSEHFYSVIDAETKMTPVARAKYVRAPLPKIEGLEGVIEWCQASYNRGNRPSPFAKDLKILFEAARAYLALQGGD